MSYRGRKSRRPINNQYERLQEENSEAGAKALAVTVKGINDKCQLCHKRGHPAPQCRSSQSFKGKQHSKFSGQYVTYGKRGHHAEECEGEKNGGRYERHQRQAKDLLHRLLHMLERDYSGFQV